MHILAISCLFVCLVHFACGDLEDQLYRAAKSSRHMTEVTRDSFDEFLLDAKEQYLAVIFHVGSCHICKSTLPILEDLAREWEENNVPIAVGHVDSTSLQEYWKRRFNFKGYPQLALWHRGEEKFAEKAVRAKEILPDAMTGAYKTVTITESKERLLDAARQVFMSLANDEQRLLGLGRDAEVVQVEYDDFTAKLRVKSVSNKMVWYPMEALLLPDGSPVMTFQRPSKPFFYRPTSWKAEQVKDFVERMMRPLIVPLKSMETLKGDMKQEKLVSLILCADELSSSPGFETLARAWQDKHRAYFIKSKNACPVDGEWPLVLSYSPENQQWHPRGRAGAAAVVAGPSIAASLDTNSLSNWFQKNRFPGFWAVDYENFHPLLHAGRDTAMVAIDDYKDEQKKEVYKILRDVVRPTAHAFLTVFTYADNSTFWGVVDGRLAGLDTFGIHTFELPRVIIFEDKTSEWVEDERELSIWNLKAGLANVPKLVRYGEGPKGFVLKHFYKPWLTYDRLAIDAGGTPARIGFNGALLIGFAYSVWSITRNCMTIFQNLATSDDMEEAEGKHPKKD
mmetsp:Transcript_121517/g.189742  ORF Transcript_121517/g.189742 Transcript_121517/m.189742 type:complete len:565 (-) Transcript_121517:135-1829(-)